MNRTTSFLAVVSLALVLPVVALADTGTSGTSAPAKSDNSAAMKQEGATAAAPATTTSKSTTHKTHAAMHSKPKMDLNTATKEELMTLPGVTEDTADKIIAARPFKSKGQLESEKILTKPEYNKVASKVTVKTASKASKASKAK